jgi:AraC family transcriptional regulator
MNRYTELHTTADLSLRRFDHPPGAIHHDPDSEVAERWAVAFVRTGAFVLVHNGTSHRLQQGAVLLTSPGMRFRCTHDDAVPCDVCDSIAFTDAAVAGYEDLWRHGGWIVRADPPPRLAFVQRRLLDATTRADAFASERWALAALTALDSDRAMDRTRGPYRPRARDVDAVRAVCEAMERHPERALLIADHARAVHRTSPQLTHAFRRYVGVSPHQYLIRHRVAHAADRLAARQSVSDSCYAAGFENLSHFTRSFQRLLGCAPSHWQRIARDERRRKVQALLVGFTVS